MSVKKLRRVTRNDDQAELLYAYSVCTYHSIMFTSLLHSLNRSLRQREGEYCNKQI